jgi:hypothetical protein
MRPKGGHRRWVNVPGPCFQTQAETHTVRTNSTCGCSYCLLFSSLVLCEVLNNKVYYHYYQYSHREFTRCPS